MAGITPNEGQDYIAEVLYSQETAVQNLTMGLFTNTTGALSQTSAWANVTQASGSGYAEINLTPGTFSIASGGVATYGASTAWSATGDWTGDVYGYYIRTQEGTPRLLHFEYAPSGARTMLNGDIYSVDLGTDTEST